MNFREQFDSFEQAKDHPSPHYIQRNGIAKKRRYKLIGGGYIALCNRTNLYLDLFNPVPYVVVRHIGWGEIGVLSHKKLKVGEDYIIALPSDGSVIGKVVYSSRSFLLPTLYRSRIFLHTLPSPAQFEQWLPFIPSLDIIDFKNDYQSMMREDALSSSRTQF
ncbi:hypothetical protein ACET85_20285 [Aeromonas veronii]|uniref:hypothetical protein n=1 Tax=Aeromonas TaxID=642 RepID=UPI0022E5F3AF|nr:MULTISPECIES: hypothetical protein [Aeromonas]